MIYGFTGTREAPTREQEAVLDEMANMGVFGGENHHGDCVGADTEFHYFAWRYGGKVVVHPPVDPKCRAFVHQLMAGMWEDDFVLLPEKPYLERNRDIVDACEKLLVVPKETQQDERPVRSGTWSTVRYAQKQGKPIVIIWPDGQIEGSWD